MIFFWCFQGSKPRLPKRRTLLSKLERGEQLHSNKQGDKGPEDLLTERDHQQITTSKEAAYSQITETSTGNLNAKH